MMLDEHWAKQNGPSTLMGQSDYLLRPIRRRIPRAHDVQFERNKDDGWSLKICSSGDELKWKPDLTEDPFLLFQPVQSDLRRGPIDHQEWSRADSFTTVGYDLREYANTNRETMVKVPLFWDFGFLMCDANLWRDVIDLPGDQLPKKKKRFLKQTWRKLRAGQAVSWSDFAIAASIVKHKAAKIAGLPQDADKSKADGALDFVTLGLPSDAGGNLSCLILEIWASEIGPQCEFRKSRMDAADIDLCGLIRRYREELFAALLIARKLLSKQQIEQFPRSVTPFDPTRTRAVAARCWFSTATPLTRASEVALGTARRVPRWRPTTLPGCFSCRGDWFLGVPRGSRSRLLAERAMDLLCSRRANVVRLQEGVGLPVRGNEDPGNAELWTPLKRGARRKSRHKDSGEPDHLVPSKHYTYREIRNLGAAGDDPKDIGGRPDMHWLWRSRIVDYDRHTRIWRRWLATMLAALRPPSLQHLRRPRDRSGDAGNNWDRFNTMVNGLLDTLSRAALLHEDGRSPRKP